MSRVIVISNDVVQRRMAGPGIRALELARCLHRAGHEVKLAVPGTTDLDGLPFDLCTFSPGALVPHAAGADVAVVQGWVLNNHPRLLQCGARMVVDLYDPIHLEGLAAFPHESATQQIPRHRRTLGAVNDQLLWGDFFLCASERQRDMWLGALAAMDRVNPLTAGDPSLRSLIDVVPFGLPSEPPRTDRLAIRNRIPGISSGDLVLLWGGGLYDWFDPLTLVRAVALAVPRLPQLRLVFHAAEHPNIGVPAMRSVTDTRELATELGLIGRHVFFNSSWVEYERRAEWLLDADVGVSTHVNSVETQFAFRTRVLDYFWAGLPVLCTAGDTMGDVVARQQLGLAVPESSPAAIADAIHKLGDDRFRAQCAKRVRRLAPDYTWDRAAGPLLAYCSTPWRAADLDGRRRLHAVPLRARPPGGPRTSAVLASAGRVLSAPAAARRAHQRGGWRAVARALARRLPGGSGARNRADPTE